MEDGLYIPEFSVSWRRDAPQSPPRTPPPHREQTRRFRKGGAVAEIRQRPMREFRMIEWSLVLNGRLITTRQFRDAEHADCEREIHGVTIDLIGTGWLEDLESVA
jgi:hypothetical protein